MVSRITTSNAPTVPANGKADDATPRAPRSFMRRFRMRDEGSVSVEAILVTPLLFTGLMISFGWYSAFRAKTDANKTAYTLADYISRQTNTVTPDFIEGMADMYRFLINDGDISLRVTSVKWSTVNNPDGAYEFVWSSGTGSLPALSAGDLSAIEPRLPMMSDGHDVVVVETESYWDAPFDMELEDFRFYNIIVNSPRFATQVPFNDPSDTSG